MIHLMVKQNDLTLGLLTFSIWVVLGVCIYVVRYRGNKWYWKQDKDGKWRRVQR